MMWWLFGNSVEIHELIYVIEILRNIFGIDLFFLLNPLSCLFEKPWTLELIWFDFHTDIAYVR